MVSRAIRHEALEELRVGVGLDRVGDQRPRKGCAVGGEALGGEALGGGVEVGQVEGRPPASGNFGGELGIEGHAEGTPLRTSSATGACAAAPLTGMKAVR